MGLRIGIGGTTIGRFNCNDIPNGNPSVLVVSAPLAYSDRLVLTWILGATNFDRIYIFRSTDGIIFSLAAYVEGNVSTYTDMGLSAYTRYYYKVLGLTCKTVSLMSNSADAYTNPPVITDGKTYWYDAAIASSITKDGANVISAWSDLFGSAQQFTTTEGAPVAASNMVTFDGDDDSMMTPSNNAIGYPRTLYAVLRMPAWTYLDRIWSGRNSADTSLALSCYPNTSGELIVLGRTGGALDAHAIAPVNAWFIVRALYDGASSFIQIDNNAAVVGTLITDAVQNPKGMCLGRAATGAERWCRFDVKEIINRNNSDSATERGLVYNYLKTKYGL